MSVGHAAAPHGVFRHEALLYAGRTGFLAGTVPFIRDGLASDEPTLVVVDAAKIVALRQALGRDADRVQFADMAEVGRNPARIIPRWRRFVDEQLRPDRPVRGIGEPIWPSRSPAELVECQTHETLLNLAFADSPAWRLLCPYDTEVLDPTVVADACRSHPFLLQDGGARVSEQYLAVHPSPAGLDRPLPPAPPDAESMAFGPGTDELRKVRDLVEGHARGAGLNSATTVNLVLAANELATNSLRHGGGRGTIRLWRDADALVCEVHDAGRLNGNPLLGRHLPALRQVGGRGLWLVNQLCDLVQIRSTAAGTMVRVRMSFDRSRGDRGIPKRRN